jgi:hypothetical protein
LCVTRGSENDRANRFGGKHGTRLKMSVADFATCLTLSIAFSVMLFGDDGPFGCVCVDGDVGLAGDAWLTAGAWLAPSAGAAPGPDVSAQSGATPADASRMSAAAVANCADRQKGR